MCSYRLIGSPGHRPKTTPFTDQQERCALLSPLDVSTCSKCIINVVSRRPACTVSPTGDSEQTAVFNT
uniref:Uncharacterized protein n=1 Tax=Anguilla anguilla TaxID=7936 RepID=A0A0E9WA91_ANGAN